MNIAIIGKFHTEAFGLHIKETLEDMGHSTLCIDPEIDFLQYDFLGKRVKNVNKTLYQEVCQKLPQVRAKASNKIYKKLETQKIDLVLVLHDYLNFHEVAKIRSITNSKIALWFPDAISNFQKAMFFIADYDILFFSDRYIVDKLKSEFDLNNFYLPKCFNPKRHKKIKINEEDRKKYNCEITNAGNLYPSRAALLSKLNQFDIKLWGYPPPIWLNYPKLNHILMNELVFNEEKCKAFTAAKIVLNNLHPAVIDGVNKRTFEIPACGGFQLISYRHAVKELFTPDKEIVCYHNLNDLKEKIEYYLDSKNKELRIQIEKAGYERAILDHSYKDRIETIFKAIDN